MLFKWKNEKEASSDDDYIVNYINYLVMKVEGQENEWISTLLPMIS